MNTLSKAMREFLVVCKDQRSLSPATIRAYQQDLNAYARWLTLEHRDCGRSSDAIVSFVASLRAGNRYSPATIRRRVFTIKAFAKWFAIQENGAFDPDAFPSITVRIPRRIPRPVERCQLKTVFKATRCRASLADGDQEHEFDTKNATLTTALAMRLLVVTGIRIGELVSIKVGDVLATDGRIRIHGKGNRERTVYVTNSVYWMLLNRYAFIRAKQGTINARLFVNSVGRPLSEAAFRKRLRTISSQLDITPHITPHQFRHAAATMLIEEGVDIRLVQRMLGHASIATTEIYTRVSDNLLRNAVAAADTLACVDTECNVTALT